LHRCAFISELGEEVVHSLVGPEAVRKARAALERGPVVPRRGVNVRRSLSRMLYHDAGTAQRIRLEVLVGSMLALGVSAGILLRLLRWATGG
jgi:hypothetical protein